MPDKGNGDWLPKPLRLFLWISTSVVVLLLLGLALFNPGNALGGDRKFVDLEPRRNIEITSILGYQGNSFGLGAGK